MAESKAVTALLRRRLALLAAAMGAAAVVAVVGADRGDSGAAAVAPAGAAAPPAVEPGGAPDVDTIEGTVAEKLDVTQYSYLRLTLDDGAEIWAAVPRAEVAVGARVTLREPQLMEGFVSPTLGRAFDRILFGSLDAGAAAPAAADGAPGWGRPADGAPRGAGRRRAAPGGRCGATAPTPGAAVEELEVGVVARAGDLKGHTIAQIHQRAASWPETRARARRGGADRARRARAVASCTCATAAATLPRGTHDLTITTLEQPEAGQTVLLEGRLTVDRDFGAGYRYPVLLEDARSVTDP